MISFGTTTVLRARHTTLVLSIAALVAGCSDSREKQAPKSPPAAAAQPVAAKVDTTPLRRPSRPAQPCLFVAGTGQCAGLLADATPTVNELVAANVLIPALHGKRKPSDTDAKTLINKDARNIDLDKLPSGKAILIGAIQFTPDAADDGYYHTSGGGGKDVRGRTAWFVLNGPATLASATNGLTVSTWTMYGIDPVTKGVKVLAGPKNVVECTQDSPYNNAAGPNSFFSGCQPAANIHALAHELKMPFDAVLAYVACRPDAKGNCTVPQPHGPHAFSVMSVEQRNELLKGIKLLTIDPTADPYWFSCGQGCCTAELL